MFNTANIENYNNFTTKHFTKTYKLFVGWSNLFKNFKILIKMNVKLHLKNLNFIFKQRLKKKFYKSFSLWNLA